MVIDWVEKLALSVSENIILHLKLYSTYTISYWSHYWKLHFRAFGCLISRS